MPQSAFFTLEARTDAFDDLARFMLLDGLSCDLIVHKCRNVVLQTSPNLIYNGLIRTFLALLFQNEVHLDDLLVCIGQVIFASHGA